MIFTKFPFSLQSLKSPSRVYFIQLESHSNRCILYRNTSKYMLFTWQWLILLFSISKHRLMALDYYNVDFTKSYTWDQIPQSCTCQETGATPATCSYFLCECTCDLFAGQCDYGCCCDPDCSVDQISRFTALGCLPDGVGPSSVQYCYSTDQLSKVNPRDPLGGQSAAQVALGEALCVQKVNYASEGYYYSDTGLQPSGVFTTSAGSKPYDFTMGNVPVILTPDAYYDLNDNIKVFYESTITPGDLALRGAGFLIIPQPDSGGICNDFNYAKFGVNQDDSSNACYRPVSANEALFTNLCQFTFSVEQLKAMRVSMHANTYEASAGVSSIMRSDSVAVSIQSVSYKDYSTGILTDVTAQWTSSTTCSTSVYSTNSAYQTGSADCKPSGFTYSSANTVCSGAVVGVEYTVDHGSDAYSTIQGVNISLILMDVPLPSLDSLVEQTTSVVFSGSSESMTQSHGNQVSRKRSGNPGYLLGTPVLFGDALLGPSGEQAVHESIKGLSVPTSIIANSGSSEPDSCAQDPAVNGIPLTESLGSQYIRFGYDQVTGCSLRLTRPELIQLCCEGQTNCGASNADSPYSYASGLPVFLQNSAGYIGIYGNADPLDVSQWIPLTLASTTGFTRQWNEQLGVCTGMITSINYRFLVAYTGEHSNPQNKIVAAAMEYTTTNLAMNSLPSDLVSTEVFPLTITVSFIFKERQDTVEYFPPPPPVLFQVPYDVFYPFINDAPENYSKMLIINSFVIIFVFVGLMAKA